MKELKALVFICGLIFLVGLAICVGGAAINDLSSSGADYFETEKKRQLAYLTELKQKADKTPVDGKINWHYSQTLKNPDTKAILNWSDKKLAQQAAYYLQKSVDANTTEGIAQTGYNHLYKAFAYQPDDNTAFDTDKIINTTALSQGLSIIKQVTLKQCDAYLLKTDSTTPYNENDYKRNIIDIADIDALIKNPALKKHPKLFTQATLLSLHNHVNCSETYDDIKRELVERIMDKKGNLSFYYVLATLINEPDIAYLFKKAATKNASAPEKANFNKHVNNMMTSFKKDYTGFVSVRQKQKAQCCQDTCCQENKTDESSS